MYILCFLFTADKLQKVHRKLRYYYIHTYYRKYSILKVHNKYMCFV